MKSVTILGIVLAILGVLALVFQGFNYTRQKTVIDVGPIHATAADQEHVQIPPLVGGLVLAGGVALILFGAKKKG
jgi:uncharacterized membrane protein